MSKSFVLRAAGVTLLAAAGAVSAQTTPATPNPTGVAVTPQTAAEAQQKAVPRTDTGTVVRTGPTAGDRTREAASNVGSAASAAVDRTASRTSTATVPARDGAGMSSTGRPARADRN